MNECSWLWFISVVVVSDSRAHIPTSATRLPALHSALSNVYQKFKLVEKDQITHNTFRLRFALPTPQHKLGLPIGQHLFLRFFDEEGTPISRPYTPITSNEHLGYFDLLIKTYPAPAKMSQHVEQMQLGDSIDVRGPLGHLEYLGRGQFSIKRRKPTKHTQEVQVSRIGMIAGGTGITPMMQIVREICQHEKAGKGQVELSLIFANRSKEDILLHEELQRLAEEHANFKVEYTLDHPPADWTYSSGLVDQSMIQQHLPGPAEDTLVLLCGPPIMCKFMKQHLAALHYTPSMCFSY